MKGDLVLVKAHGGKPLIRRVWEETDKAVFVVPEDEYLRLGETGVPGPIIGFPRKDVFECGEKEVNGEVDWEECRPWEGKSN